MVRACRPPAREPGRSWVARRSTTATSTPASASSPASISPVGPPPAITTSCSVNPALPSLPASAGDSTTRPGSCRKPQGARYAGGGRRGRPRSRAASSRRMPAMAAPASIPPELFLATYSPNIQDIAERLRGVVREAVPEAIERVRSGWRLIGYDIPVGRRTRYFAFVAPEPNHVHLGFEYGIWMSDPDRILRGAHLQLKKVRYVTYEPGDEIPTDALVRFTEEAAELATL